MTLTDDARATCDAMAEDYVAAEDNPYNALYEQPKVRDRFPEAWERLTKNPHFLFLRLVAR